MKVRRLSDEEGRKLQRLVRRGEAKGQASVVRRAMVVLASAFLSSPPTNGFTLRSDDRALGLAHRMAGPQMGHTAWRAQVGGGHKADHGAQDSGLP
jgi:hypothetical protein